MNKRKSEDHGAEEEASTSNSLSNEILLISMIHIQCISFILEGVITYISGEKKVAKIQLDSVI